MCPPLNPCLNLILGSKGLSSCDPRAFSRTTITIPWSMEGGSITGGGHAFQRRHVPFWPFSLTLEVKGNVLLCMGPVPSGPPLATTLAGASSLAEPKPHSPVAGEENTGWGWGATTKFLRRFTGNICHRDPLSACEMHFLPRRGSRMTIGGGIGLQGGRVDCFLVEFFSFGVFGTQSTSSSNLTFNSPLFGPVFPVLEGDTTKGGG